MPTLQTVAIPLLCLLLAACGKTDEPKSNDDHGGTDEPPPLGNTDYGAPPMTGKVLTAEAKTATAPKVLFNGADYSLIWASDGGRQLKLQRVGKDGTLVGEAVVVYDSTGDATKVVTEGRYDFALAGDRYLIILQAAKVYYGVVDGEGKPVKEFTPVTASGMRGFPEASTDGTDFGVVYTTQAAASSPSNVVFRRIAADGAADAEVTVGEVAHSFQPDVAWSSASQLYGIVWHESASAAATPELHFAAVDKGGAIATANKAVTTDDGFSSKEPRIAPFGAGFGVLFRDFRDVKLVNAAPISGIPHVRLCHVDATGSVMDVTGDGAVDGNDHFMISSPYEEEATTARFAVQGVEWGIVWAAQSAPFSVFHARAKLAGGVLTMSPKQILTAPGATALTPDVGAEADGKFLAVWGESPQLHVAN